MRGVVQPPRDDGANGRVEAIVEVLVVIAQARDRTPVSENLVASVSSPDTLRDTFIALYCEFDAASPLSGLVATDDDDGPLDAAAFHASDGILLKPNTSYFFVITRFGLWSEDGDFQIDFGGSVEVVPGADLVLSKQGSPDEVVAGSGTGNLLYTLIVQNNGPDGSSGSVLFDTLPCGINYFLDVGLLDILRCSFGRFANVCQIDIGPQFPS